ncbi:MAG: hypothetical protein ACREDR_03395, partial [Blastocatellia bacterium]
MKFKMLILRAGLVVSVIVTVISIRAGLAPLPIAHAYTPSGWVTCVGPGGLSGSPGDRSGCSVSFDGAFFGPTGVCGGSYTYHCKDGDTSCIYSYGDDTA